MEPPEAAPAPWWDVIVAPPVFDKARKDLKDLRLYTADGQEIPYALRVRVAKSDVEPLESDLFNPTQTPDGASEVTLDLRRGGLEHNEIQVELPGVNYRRRVQLEGSDGGDAWRPLCERTLVYFERGGLSLRDQGVSYPLSRYRYLRLRVFRDPEVEVGPVALGKVTALRRVEVPGETLRLPAELGPGEPARVDREPGSAWLIALGGDRTPVRRIEVAIADAEFARDYRLEAGGPPDSGRPFTAVASGVWRRRAGEEPEPMVAEFKETRAACLRLLVKDGRNPPLQIQAVHHSAPARQIIFAPPPDGAPVRLYFWNPDADAAVYDFGRNLPEKLEPAPARAKLGARRENPDYVPKALPLTERWSWLIYAVMGMVIAALAALLVSLSREAIRAHDRLAPRPRS
ncbi:MAG: DUF3999 family protein [Planctomycetota bacterium]